MEISFPIDSKLTKQLKAIDLKAARQAELLAAISQQDRAALHTQARISTIGATTRIENAVLTDAQIEWIDTTLSQDGRPTAFAAQRAQIEAKLAQDRERSLEEVAGCREMLALIYSQGPELFPLSQATLCGLHRQLLQYYPPAAHYLGIYRRVPNSVIERNEATGVQRMVLETSPPGPITETAVADLLAWYNQTIRQYPWPIAVGCELVFRFLACHPFQDGNGRLGRALFLLALLQCQDEHLNQVAPYLAVDRFIEQNRSEYYAVLARISGGRFHPDPREYDLQPFLAFMLKAVDAALDSIGLYKRRIDLIRGLSAPATEVLRCFQQLPEHRLTPSAIRQQTRIAERTVSRILKTLVEAGLLQRYGRGAGTRYQLVF
jgi:Fic family protein